MAYTSIFSSRSSEQLWVQQITEISEKEVKIHIDDVPVSIFRVPATLAAFKPEAYSPQLVGLGPYHHLRSDLYEMERCKFTAIRRVREKYNCLELKKLVHFLRKIEHEVRACYHKYLDIEGETLAWIMAIDGLFLIDFLENAIEKEKDNPSSTTTTWFVASEGRKLARDSILRDMTMLENQLPIRLLTEISFIHCLPYDFLPSILMNFCEALSPLKQERNLSFDQVSNCKHLLDVLYHMIVPKLREQNGTCCTNGKSGESRRWKIPFFTTWSWKIPVVNMGDNSEVFSKLSERVPKTRFLHKLVLPVKIIAKVVSITSKQNENKKSDDVKKTLKVEEIMIPSVSTLCKVGVHFCPTNGGVSTIKFDKKTRTFYLPVINLNVNSEVILRNLVAYEASYVSDSLVLARYAELMNGIIDKVEDAKLLKENKIIINSLKSDTDVAEIFNGMSKSIRLTNVYHIDTAIEDVTNYYFSRRKVRLHQKVKKCVYGSWRILTIMAVISLMLLTALQTFCSIFDCPSTFGSN